MARLPRFLAPQLPQDMADAYHEANRWYPQTQRVVNTKLGAMAVHKLITGELSLYGIAYLRASKAQVSDLVDTTLKLHKAFDVPCRLVKRDIPGDHFAFTPGRLENQLTRSWPTGLYMAMAHHAELTLPGGLVPPLRDGQVAQDLGIRTQAYQADVARAVKTLLRPSDGVVRPELLALQSIFEVASGSYDTRQAHLIANIYRTERVRMTHPDTGTSERVAAGAAVGSAASALRVNAMTHLVEAWPAIEEQAGVRVSFAAADSFMETIAPPNAILGL